VFGVRLQLSRKDNSPMVGMVVTTSPSLSLYRIVVLPAASSPTMRMRISCFENRLSNSLLIVKPILLSNRCAPRSMKMKV
jgi:hypothetical protein